MHNDIRLVAMDLDGTLTQHKTPLSPTHRATLTRLSEKYKLLMVGAGQVMRIFNQMEQFPIDIIGNYGMQESAMVDGEFKIIREDTAEPDKEYFNKTCQYLREKYGYTEYAGGHLEFHPSGMVTFCLIGSGAKVEDKVVFDPDRSKRRAIHEDVKQVFSDYIVFVGGSSSFDMAPFPFNKAYALAKYCDERGIKHSEVVYIGDDYGEGGNDESVYKADFNYLKIDDYRDFANVVKELL